MRTRSPPRKLARQTPIMAGQKLAPDVEFCIPIPAVRSKILIDPEKLGGAETSVLVDAPSRFAVNVCHAYIAVWCRGLAVQAGYDGIRGGHQHEYESEELERGTQYFA